MRGEPIRHKSEAIKAVWQHIKNLQVVICPEFKRFHSDYAEELHHKYLLEMLKIQGTVTITTAPHSSKK